MYNIGDYVRITNDDAEGAEVNKGDVGQIVAIDKSSYLDPTYFVKILPVLPNTIAWSFGQDSIEEY